MRDSIENKGVARRRRWGAHVADGATRFRVWAPQHARIGLRVGGSGEVLSMAKTADGWHTLASTHARPGSRYRFVLPDGREVPDPASLCQPDGAEAASEVFDPTRYAWQHAWRGRPWHEAVLYELHVGTFTRAGTFRAAIDRLPHLVALGVTALEIMPVAAFPGTRNWGYDGVLPYAPASAYGRPEDLQALVDAAHGAGLMVMLDVVYNHFGPQGSVMHGMAPAFFTERHHTPWGAGFAFEQQPAVREFFIDNALYWLDAYRLDGLRLDAVHAIQDDSPEHIIDEIARAVAAQDFGRPVHLILENEHNEAHRLERADGEPVLFTAQWNDDVHHTLHVAATTEATGYYADYVGDADKLGRSLAEGFAYQGEILPYTGHPRGEPSAHLPPVAFISFIQNHDQVGNRAMGDRIAALAPREVVRALASVYLLLPQVPMLFMGEEWGSKQPFAFFCDFEGNLNEAVVEGRRNEFARFPEFSDPAQRARIPDPTSEGTFLAAKLRWEEADQPDGAEQLLWYQQVLDVRHREIVPRLPGITSGGSYRMHGGVVEVRWDLGDGSWLTLVANLTARAWQASLPDGRRVIWCHGSCTADEVGPWSVEWSIDTG